MDESMLVLESPDAVLRVDLAAGGRMASLCVFGHEVLVGPAADPLGWGSYPLAPWAGRLRGAGFRRGKRSWQMPLNMPPHAIHGTVYRRAWAPLAHDSIGTSLGPDWPFEGHAVQRFMLTEGALRVRLEVHSEEQVFFASAGFHPWFRRSLGGAAAVELDFDAPYRYRFDSNGCPTGELLPPGPRPWDDCFVGLTRGPVLRWPGALCLRLGSSHAHWVVYDQPHALCVEPWTAPPDALNGAADRVRPGRPLVLEFDLHWQRDP